MFSIYIVWIGNCVGYFNHRYFYLFMGYLSFGAFLYSILMAPILLSSAEVYRKENGISFEVVSFSVLLSCVMGLSITLMFAFHTYLVLTNQTSIEFYDNIHYTKIAKSQGRTYTNIFDMGWKNNLYEFLGVPRGGWMFLSLIPHVRPVLGNGYEFKTVPYVPQPSSLV